MTQPRMPKRATYYMNKILYDWMNKRVGMRLAGMTYCNISARDLMRYYDIMEVYERSVLDQFDKDTLELLQKYYNISELTLLHNNEFFAEYIKYKMNNSKDKPSQAVIDVTFDMLNQLDKFETYVLLDYLDRTERV